MTNPSTRWRSERRREPLPGRVLFAAPFEYGRLGRVNGALLRFLIGAVQ